MRGSGATETHRSVPGLSAGRLAWETLTMRVLWGIVLGLGALLCSALFLLFAVTKFRSGSWLMYLFIAGFGLGAAGCFVAARQRLAQPVSHPGSS
jgi:ABC-type thiamin/hydroxymethylpyrimidine transport system permease subunit